MISMKKCNYVISAVAAILGATILFFAFRLGIGFKAKGGIESGTWPGIMGGLLVFTAIILLIMTLSNKQKYEEMQVALKLPGNKLVYVMMGVFVAYCALLTVLGLYLSALVLIPAIMFLLGERNKKKMVIVTACTIVAVYVIFSLVLGTKLPQPIWM
ncbi:MAG: tripartite tricarboxylate transporter TctB family protein [Lachnospiraceae bacterium]|nr:tripartite tricarboxylate transporter TctB family protein [Lachnospiraceae bacterium]